MSKFAVDAIEFVSFEIHTYGILLVSFLNNPNHETYL